MKIVIAPDSFKGSLSSEAAAIGDKRRDSARITGGANGALIPMADGGEGTVDSLVQATQRRQRSPFLCKARCKMR